MKREKKCAMKTLLAKKAKIEKKPAQCCAGISVIAAGDAASKSFRRITTAVSDGAIAAIQAARELES